MDERLWRYLPQELHTTIMEFLPFESLLRFRVVSKKWNDFLLEQQFQDGRVSICRDFIERIQRYPIFQSSDVKCSNNRCLLAVRGGEDIYVMKPSKVSVRRLPRLQLCSSTNLEWDVMGMVVNNSIENYSVFVASKALLTSRQLGEFHHGLKVHQYKSVTGRWSSCGIIKLSRPTDRLVGFAVHGEDCLVLSQSDSWEIAPLLFHREGRLQLMKFSRDECRVWEYGDSTQE